MVTKRTTSQTFQKFLVLILAAVLVSCAPQQATQSPVDIQAQVSTSVAMTVSAQNAATASAQMLTNAANVPTVAVALPTLTPLPTVTPFVAPTAVVSSSGGGGSGGGGGSADYACDPDISKKPRDNTEINKGDTFTVSWTILNTGTKTWKGYDLNYFSGLTPSTTSFPSSSDVKPGQSVSVSFLVTAPTIKGSYVMTWKLEGGFCYPYIAINVK